MLLLKEVMPGVLAISLNRPEKRNALNGPLMEALISALKDAENNSSIKIIFLSGEGEHFCAGADMAWMQKMATLSFEENRADAMQLSFLLQTIKTNKKPVIGLVQGV